MIPRLKLIVFFLVLSLAPARSAFSLARGGLEASYIQSPQVAALIGPDGRQVASRIGPDGAFRNVRNSEKGPLAVQVQRQAYQVIAAGLVASGRDRDQLLDQGLRALEWGFSQSGSDGSFPEARNLLSKATFLESAGRSLLLLRQSDVGPSYTARYQALIPQLRRSARWMATSDDLRSVFARDPNVNQALFIAVSIHEAGVLSDDSTLTAAAKPLVERTLRRQQADGVFPERRGFDTNYQAVSLELLARYASTVSDSAWRTTVQSAAKRGLQPLLRQITANGVDTSTNTRTAACGPAITGSGPKGKRVDATALRLLYIGHALGNQAALARSAQAVQSAGQVFLHQERCGASNAR